MWKLLMGRGAAGKRRLSRTSAVFAAAMAFSLAIAGTALADNLIVDGDGLTPVAGNAMNLGSVCAGNSASGNALLAIQRTGSGQNVFANGSTVTVSAGAPSDANVAAAFSDNGIALPGNWTGVANNTMSADTATSQVTVNAAGAPGAKSATILYTANGTRASDGGALVRTATLTIDWTVAVCDTTPPVITPNISGTLGDAGWYVSDVLVEWNVSDGESAITATSGCDAAPISTDTPGQMLTCSATSAGGTAQQTVTIKRDGTAPTISGAATPAANGNGWNNSDVSVAFTCDDAMSGIKTCGPNQTLSSEGTGQSVLGTAVDAAGNVASATVGPINLDKSAPTVSASASPAPNGNGWNNSAVTVSFSGSDALSGIAGCDPAVVLAAQGGGQAATGSCWDAAGNSASATASNINIDTVAPAVSLVGGPQDGGVYYFGSVPSAPVCNASDATSGLSGSCAVSGYGTGIGSHTVIASASDLAGNTKSVSVSYTVEKWSLVGFHAPVDMAGYVNTVKGGSTVPLKFEVFAGAELTDIAVVKSLTAVQTGCSSNLAEAPIEELAAAGGTLLRYDADTGQFIYNWKTLKAPGKCYKVTLTTQDGSTLVANFSLK